MKNYKHNHQGGRFGPRSKRVGTGPPCPRCNHISLKYTHADGWLPDPNKAWYETWFRCINHECSMSVFFNHENIYHPLHGKRWRGLMPADAVGRYGPVR